MTDYDGTLGKIQIMLMWFTLIIGIEMIGYALAFVSYLPWPLYWALVLVGAFCASLPVYMHITQTIGLFGGSR